MKQLLIATSNKGKFRELSDMLSGRVDKLFSLADFPAMILPPETGSSFKENALIKARHAAEVSGMPAIADDSGLEVEYLGGRPGVHSARYAGDSATDAENNEKLLLDLSRANPDQRAARFRCCIAFCNRNGECETFSGELPGTIIEVFRGSNGFGYDPLFLVTGHDRTLAELDLETKNRISHRAEAFRNFMEHLATLTR